MSIIPICFPEAEEPWLPTLWDILKRQSDSVKGYEGLGFEYLEIPAECTHILARKQQLVNRFNTRYATRMVNKETLQVWQMRLQNRFDEVCFAYERAYTLYEQYATEMMELYEGYERTDNTERMMSDDYTPNLSDTVRRNDTPWTAVNENQNFGKSRETVEHAGESNRTVDDSIDIRATRRDTGISLQMNVVRSFREWVDIDTALIGEFENNFLNVFWY